jgi:hydroxymethylpyrimidine/phosphomethylpyrimidine kinase
MAAAMTSGLARGMIPPDAIAFAKRYIIEAVRHSYPLGAGHGPVSPLWTVRPWWHLHTL